MSGKKPLAILTDQDKAMSKALASQWPETYHCLCVWHINQNTVIHLSNIFVKYKDFAKDFSSCMFDHENVEDFINAWDKMIETYGLQENEWLKRMFKIREKWALVYGQEAFCGDMITTQRSESMNSVIKKYISYKNELVEFFENFEVLLKDCRYKEFRANFSNSQSTPSSSFAVRISLHAAKVYTQTIYELFNVEVCKSHDCSLEISGEKDTVVEFKVQSYGKSFQHRVTYDAVGSLVLCSCKKFEFAGILCSHALNVLNFKQIVKIHDRYIKKRWIKTAKKQNVRVDFQDMSQVDPRESLTYRYKDLCQYYSKLIARAAESKNRYKIARQGLQKLLEEVDACSEDDDAQDQCSNQTTDAYISNPLDSTEGGNPSCKKIRGIKPKERITYKTSKRPKSCLEKGTKRRKSKTSVPRSENEDLRRSNDKLGLANKDTVKESHSMNGTNYSLDVPYSIANMHLNQNSCGEGLTQPEFDVSLSSTNSFTFLSSNDQEPESSFIDLLKAIDPGVNDQHVSMGYNPKYLLRQPQNDEQGDWVKK